MIKCQTNENAVRWNLDQVTESISKSVVSLAMFINRFDPFPPNKANGKCRRFFLEGVFLTAPFNSIRNS